MSVLVVPRVTQAWRVSEDGARLFSVVPSHRMSSNGHKINHKKFNLNREEEILRVEGVRALNQLPREGVEFSLETFQTHLSQVILP